jgi:UDP-N-acetylglucosamine 4,6-dehydratase
MEIENFKNKTQLITGGTGSFGNSVLDRFLTPCVNAIRISGYLGMLL